MKRNYKSIKLIPFICVILLAGYTGAQDANPCKTGGQTTYFGVEMDNILCGYAVETYCDGFSNGMEVRFEYTEVILKMSALGANVDAGFRWKYTLDPVTHRALEIKADITNGESVVTIITKVDGDTAWYSSPTSGVKKAVSIDSDVVFASQSWYPHLYKDFIKMNVAEKRYKVYDPIKGEVTEKGYVRKSEESIVLSDSAFQTLVLEETDFSTGIKTNIWLNKADGYNVKAVVAGRRTIFFADKSVTSRITFASIDNELFAGVDRKVPDIMNLSRLKVKAKINSYGENLSVQSLNFPGQKFEGTVNGSLIDGIFEVEPVRYKGKNAPPFPPDFSRYPGLEKYLRAELMIESDNPQIISKASGITSGSKDSWEASVRLSKWVAENIAGAIPGGISAINTLNTGEAECGGHSRLLAAFCRATGIPARLSVGCMYTVYHSGGFGQHAWTEVFMGDAGWIPVDATINEPDFIDAGHIRMGENATFRPVSMEILDFRTGSENAEAINGDDYSPLTGSYMNIEQYRMFKIIQKNGGLAIDIPGRIVFDLNLPDDQGKWYPKMTREISLTPERNPGGEVDKMILHQYYRLRKTSPPDSIMSEIPQEFRKYTGNYQFTPARLSLDVRFPGGNLTTTEPLGRSKESINYVKKGDTWIDHTGTYEIGFITGDDQKVVALNLTIRLDFLRGEPVTNAVEPLISVSGVDAGLRKYDEIKNTAGSGYLFSEQMLHQLGHNLLHEKKTDEAIKVFEKNVQEYPGSFMAIDALAETYMQNGDNKRAVKYFKKAVKMNPGYEYGRRMIDELKLKK